MNDLTYRDALNGRLTQLFDTDSAVDGERAFGEGEGELIDQWRHKNPATPEEVDALLLETFEELARVVSKMCDALTGMVTVAFVARAASRGIRRTLSHAGRVKPVRQYPSEQSRRLIHDQRLAIRRQYAWRRGR